MARDLFVTIKGVPRPMCCVGCQMVASTITEMGLEHYYEDRSHLNNTAAIPSELETLKALALAGKNSIDDSEFPETDHQELKNSKSKVDLEPETIELSLTGVKCAACGWLIETRLERLQAVKKAVVNVTNSRLNVVFDPSSVSPAELMRATEELGYPARPFLKVFSEDALKAEHQSLLIRLIVAGLFAMQSMMAAAALYIGAFQDMSFDNTRFFEWVLVVLSLPVVTYAGWPFYRQAYFALKARAVTMDVPIALALILVVGQSLYNVISGSGDIYLESTAMFVFFLLGGRYIELRARMRAYTLANHLIEVKQQLCRKIEGGQIIITAPDQLQAGDQIEVLGDETLSTDARLLSASALFSLSLISGESKAVRFLEGETIPGGAQNCGSSVRLEVVRTEKLSTPALIEQLVMQAGELKPGFAKRADALARWFLARLLLLSVLIGGVWLMIDPSRVVDILIAVLVATCPCALALATPLSYTMSTAALLKRGLVLTQSEAFERLTQISDVIFDKTGTLTQPISHISGISSVSDTTERELLSIASALELGSSHPVGRSICAHAARFGIKTSPALGTEHRPQGVIGTVQDQRYAVGSLEFCSDLLSLSFKGLGAHSDVLLVDLDQAQVLGGFSFNHELKPGAAEALSQLKSSGLKLHLLSGDTPEAANQLASALNIEAVHGGYTPSDKLNYVQALQKSGAKVLMVGDGTNDAPVIAAADVSIAMAQASELSQTRADAILISSSITPVLEVYRQALRTRQIIRQNLSFSLIYNLGILIPAALGLVTPWMAAIGMSLSSAFVVLNTTRLANLPKANSASLKESP